MADPKKNEKPKPGIRQPQGQAAKGKFGLRVRSWHEEHIKPVAELEAPAAELSPVATGVATPVTTGVATPVATPVTTPATTGVTTPVTTPVEYTRQPRYQSLDATHTPSEQLVYSVMYRLTLARGASDRYFPTNELMRETGIRGDHTVRRAIDGLLEKRSIALLSFRQGDKAGPLYRVFHPRDIITARRAAGIHINEQTKRVERSATPVATPVATPPAAPVITTPATPVTATPVTGPHEGREEESWENLFQRALALAIPGASLKEHEQVFAAFLQLVRKVREGRGEA